MTLHCGELAAVATALLWTLSTLAWTSAGRRIGVVSVRVIRLVIATLLTANSKTVGEIRLPAQQ